ncbi:MAG: hypothetical protein WC081_05960 [Candidatus Ratteibacteria bacterium]|jgi:hypothetical protein
MKKEISSFFRPKVQFYRVSFFVLFLIASSCFLFSVVHYRKEIIQFTENEKVLNGKVEELTKENDGLKASSPNVVWMQSLHQPKLSSQEIQNLKKKGLKNPVNDIVADLIKHSELIPYQGTLGGKMGFYSEKDIYVLSTKLVRASFEDGHTGGWMLLEYQVMDKNKISWKVLESYLE